MPLTPEQLQIIRDSVIDDAAFERVVSLIGEVDSPPSQESLLPQRFLFNLDGEQAGLLSALLNAIPTA